MTTLDKVAEIITIKYGISAEAAEDAATTYLDQMDELDGTDTDPDELTDEQADFLVAAVGSALRAGDLSNPHMLQDLADAQQELENIQLDLRTAEQARDKMLRTALMTGVRPVDVIAATGLSKTRVYQIRDAKK